MKKGFTLGEVLVTLTIIGVVAAITMPTMVQTHQKQTLVAQLSKTYNVMNQAVSRLFADSRASFLGETIYSNGRAGSANAFLTNYFDVGVNCNTTPTPCFANAYKNMAGTAITFPNILNAQNFACASLRSGASICLDGGMTPNTYTDGTGVLASVGHSRVFIDVNGAKGPNTLGRDSFYLEIYNDGKIGESYNEKTSDEIDTDFENCRTAEDNLTGCFNRIVRDGWKINY